MTSATKRVCIFVDGENLRNSIVELFPNFKKHDYLPKKANWTDFFDFISKKAGGENSERLRTYWYVVQTVDFCPNPRGQSDLENERNLM
jgi:hypothetical protein